MGANDDTSVAMIDRCCVRSSLLNERVVRVGERKPNEMWATLPNSATVAIAVRSEPRSTGMRARSALSLGTAYRSVPLNVERLPGAPKLDSQAEKSNC